MSTDRAFHFDVIVAPPDLTVPGTRLVGFSERSGARFSHQLMPRPSLGIAVDCTQGSLTATGGSARASALVGGMTPRSVVSGATFECLEIQLSPLLARALLDVHPAELGRPLVALDDIWGADAERLRNRIIDAASWAERFDLVHAMLTKRLARHSDATHRPDPSRVTPGVASCDREDTSPSAPSRGSTGSVGPSSGSGSERRLD